MTRKHSERGNRVKRRLDRSIGSVLIAGLSVLRRSRSRPTHVARIGLLMFGVIGDTLLAAAIVHDLKRAFPFARIIAFISKANKGTLELLEGFDEVIVVPIMRPTRAIPLIRRHPVDVLIDIGQWARISALIARLARSHYTVGFSTPGQRRHLAFDAVVEHRADRHEIENFRALLSGVGVEGHSMPRLKPALLADASVPSAQPYVVLHPWASGYRSELREWAMSNWVCLARLILDWGYDIMITGGPEDQSRSEALAASLPASSRVTVLAGRASLRDTAVALGRARGIVSVNTGIMHLAALFNRPMVALHGPTNAKRWGPLSQAARVVGPGPEAGGGFLNLGFEYPRSPPDCMAQISIAEVTQTLWTLLGGRIPVVSNAVGHAAPLLI